MNKKNRRLSNLSKTNSLLIKFNIDSDNQIISWFRNFNLEFFKVSSLVQRWVVEVPFWKEEEYDESMSNRELIDGCGKLEHFPSAIYKCIAKLNNQLAL